MSVSTVVEKVQKLLALSKSANAHEAAAAAGAANRLMDQYRLSEADLEVQGQSEEPIEEDGGYVYESGKVTHWKKILMSVLIKHYGLAHWNDTTYTSGRKVSRYKLVGRKNDITVMKYMFAWLTAECQRLSALEAKGQGRVFVSSYCEGFVNGVATQLALSRADVEKTASNAAIVKIDARAQEASNFLSRLHTNLVFKKTTSYRQTDYAAFSQGKVRGSSLHLGKTISAGLPKLLK
jgi:hypothetical protein